MSINGRTPNGFPNHTNIALSLTEIEAKPVWTKMFKDDVYIILISDGNFDQGIIDFNLIDIWDVIDR